MWGWDGRRGGVSDHQVPTTEWTRRPRTDPSLSNRWDHVASSDGVMPNPGCWGGGCCSGGGGGKIRRSVTESLGFGGGRSGPPGGGPMGGPGGRRLPLSAPPGGCTVGTGSEARAAGSKSTSSLGARPAQHPCSFPMSRPNAPVQGRVTTSWAAGGRPYQLEGRGLLVAKLAIYATAYRQLLRIRHAC